jgi:hypothetical protein
MGSTRWRSWLRHNATSRKVAGSIPYGVTGIFHWHNPSGRTMSLGSTQPLTEMNTGYISCGVKTAGASRYEMWEPQLPGTLWACPGLYRDCFTFCPPKGCTVQLQNVKSLQLAFQTHAKLWLSAKLLLQSFAELAVMITEWGCLQWIDFWTTLNDSHRESYRYGHDTACLILIVICMIR